MSVICTRHPGASVAHQSDTTCPLCVATRSLSLAETKVDLAERKVRIAERRIREIEGGVLAFQIPLLQGVARR